ncbi:DNA repair protein RecN [Desulfofundulus salinus]|uniref:DNA repair protein RecN n=1 Tax=Desulfofundulus salinus TaxID=2419843 RepID=A0A494X1J1_9FIRM|nr:DNA repair protein RecN [Desulfofundulus salinum]RKO66780.1 DNA repair protein RecN [Desulfofundulus salinum]
MLVSLDIQDFGLIDRQTIEFTPGLNVLTGETGAGKSIVVEALQVALGGRAWAEFIRTGKERARVAAVFEVHPLAVLKEKLKAWGIPLEDDGILVMARELARSGRNICRLNGQVVALSVYREAGQHLVDIHGQHESQSLFNPDHHRDLLDRFGGLWSLRQEVAEIYHRWRDLTSQLEELRHGARDRLHRLDMLTYQVQEIDRARLLPEEEEALTQERNRLANAEKIAALAGRCYQALHGGEEGIPAVMDLLGRACRDLEELSRLDPDLSSLASSLDGVLYQVEDVARELARYRDGVEFNPSRLQEVEERLSRIRDLKRKYGDSVEEILRYREEAAAELELLASSEENTAALEDEIKLWEERWQQKALDLSRARREHARKLEEAVARELADLEMGNVEFQVLFEDLSQPSATGRERVEFLISPNPGEPLRPLARIASGGELSRVMLAMRAILATVDELPTLVFDEVDAGIGGRTLVAVAEKLADIAGHRQVVCVTHAAQIASFARTHFSISKEVRAGQTTTRVRRLDEEGRLAELARMLGGREADGLARDHARHLLEQARERIEIARKKTC